MNYRLLNNILGWTIGIFATVIYTITMEPTVSFWDCGEFIAGAYKLQVVHPPGAPLFLMIARIFTIAGEYFGGVDKVALSVNFQSALSSGMAILFLFWTITLICKKLIGKAREELDAADKMVIMGSAIIGSLACTFVDTFWFSAVEGEVYAMSSFIIALLFWAILRWENRADEPYADKWLLLIAFIIGLSIGVHLLGLLAIPPIALVYYFKRFKPSNFGMMLAFFIGFVVLVFVQYFIIPGLTKLAGNFDIYAVNTMELPFWSGVTVFMLLVAGFLGVGIYYSQYKNLTNSFLIGMLVILNFAVVGALVAGFLINLVFIGIYYYSKQNLAKTCCLFYLAIIPGFFVWEKLFKNMKPVPKHVIAKNVNTMFLAITFIILGFSSYIMVVVRSNANPSIDMSNPEEPFNLLSYLNREQYGHM
ncbi:MAG: DUF2723 domain-containing protein, partial [Bacteroidetes bacterium]|nr:DUF2723 domain-containing protein [Bacteroidota bacterium]